MNAETRRNVVIILLKLVLWLLAGSFILSGIRELAFPAGILCGINIGWAKYPAPISNFLRL